jgi:16S rRNA (cytosine1402-N4)-methyltransferase
MVQEVTGFFQGAPDGAIVDGTAGGGGHLEALRLCFPGRSLVAMERDPVFAAALVKRFRDDPMVAVHNRSYTEIQSVLIAPAAGALFDLGLSSLQLDDPSRGFSHRLEGPLDMRFDTSRGEPMHELLRSMGEAEIADVIYRYGQEGRSRRIAREIRSAMPVRTTLELRAAVMKAVGGNPVKPLSRVFQAFRILVNDELVELERLVAGLHQWLAPLGRVAFITFHSIEDRAVKLLFRDSPHFQCTDPPWQLPSPEEARENPRARSARLRTAVRAS